MLTFICLSLVALIIFWMIGFGVVNIFSPSSKFGREIAIILGFSLTTFSAYLTAYFGFSIWVLPTVVLFTVLFSLVRIWKLKTSIGISYSKRNTIKELGIFAIGSCIYAVAQSSSLLSPGFHLRTGPDLMGWAISSNHFIKNDNLEILWTSITRELQSTNRLELFTNTNPAHSVYTLASFNDQVSAEFLIGSNRVGLPALIGFISRLTDLPAFTLLWTLICCFGGITSLVCYKFLSRGSIPNIIRIAAMASVVGSTAIIAPIVEGGIWQIFIVPCMLIGLICLYEVQYGDRFQDLSLVVFATSMLIVSLTSDILIVIAPLLLLSFLIFLHKRAFKPLVWFVLAIISPLFFGIRILMDSLLARSRDALVGGWSAAGLPFPADVFGITPWQEPTGRFTGSLFYSPEKIILSILLTFLIAFAIAKGNSWGRNLNILYLSFSTVIVSFSYLPRLLNGSGNNYIPWKLAFIFGVAMPIILCALVEPNSANSSTSKLIDNERIKGKKFANKREQKPVISEISNIIVWLILLLEVLQLTRWQLDWHANSNSNAPISFATTTQDSELRKKSTAILLNYDFVGTCVPWFTSISLSGDLRSMSLRGESIRPRDSIPVRKKAFALDRNLTNCQKYTEFLVADSPIAILGSLEIFDVTSKVG
jgi:hypothetical protein